MLLVSYFIFYIKNKYDDITIAQKSVLSQLILTSDYCSSSLAAF